MAIIKPGPLVSEVRGKIGGVVFARNGGGLYIRNFAAPTQGESSSRENSRARLGVSANAWNGLTEGAREGWRLYGREVGTVNSLGETQTLSGIAAFIRSNTLLDAAGQGIRTSPPEHPIGGPSIFITNLVLDDFGVITLDAVLAAPLGGSDVFVVAQGSPPVTPGRISPAGIPLRIAGSAEASDIEGPVTVTIQTQGLAVAAGELRFLRFRTVTEDGRVGPPQIQRVQATEAP